MQIRIVLAAFTTEYFLFSPIVFRLLFFSRNNKVSKVIISSKHYKEMPVLYKRLLILPFLLASCTPNGDSSFKRACIEAIKSELISPSSFELVDYFPNHYPIPSGDEEQIVVRLKELGSYSDQGSKQQLEILNLRMDLANIRSGESAKMYSAEVIYDSDNLYGAALRGFSECSREEKFGEFDASYLLVDVD